MGTFLFDKIIFGPVKSRRLGNSLGINLLPTDFKICNFNCIYCECGWTLLKNKKFQFINAEDYSGLVSKELKRISENNIQVDTITFAGNGEPTMHPDFDKIIEITIRNRDIYFPKAKIAVLSNSTLIGKSKVFEALQKIELNILKLDSGIFNTIKILNGPPANFTLEKLTENLKQFKGNFIMQTMFIRGEYNGKTVDNTSETEIEKWLDIVKTTKPKLVMIYTIRRDTPVNTLFPVQEEELKRISILVKEAGFKSEISS